jgi:hypothetical protein
MGFRVRRQSLIFPKARCAKFPESRDVPGFYGFPDGHPIIDPRTGHRAGNHTVLPGVKVPASTARDGRRPLQGHHAEVGELGIHDLQETFRWRPQRPGCLYSRYGSVRVHGDRPGANRDCFPAQTVRVQRIVGVSVIGNR